MIASIDLSVLLSLEYYYLEYYYTIIRMRSLFTKASRSRKEGIFELAG